jgi:hypothetical protein
MVGRMSDYNHSAMQVTSDGPTPTGIQKVTKACGYATQIPRLLRMF